MNYLSHYIKLIKKSQNRINPTTYTEKHHIFPKSLFNNSDIVVLTAREHFIAHLLLYKGFIKRYGLEHYKTIKMGYAFKLMSLKSKRFVGKRYYSRHFEKLRLLSNQRFGDLNPSKRPEVREKIRNSKIGVPRPDLKGKKYFGASEETYLVGIEKMRRKKTGMKTNYPQNRKSSPCSQEKANKISESRLKTNDKYINMSKKEFTNWLETYYNKDKLWRVHTFGANFTRAIKARGEKVIYYEELFPRRNKK